MKKDNSTLSLKVSLRRNLLKELAGNPVILETHGGFGGVFKQAYFNIANGVVFEKDADRASALAKQRPTWAVYEGDSTNALAAGVGAHLEANFIDFDPYGEPWPVIDAFFQSERPFPKRLVIVVNDGLRQRIKMNGGWTTKSMTGVVAKYGNAALYKRYVEICQELLQEKASQRGYTLTRWAGYYCGYLDQMTHYGGIFIRDVG